MNTRIDIKIERISPAMASGLLPDLTGLLMDTVNHGASIGFLAPLELAQAHAYWLGVLADMEDGATLLWVARAGEQVVGTVQLQTCPRANGRNRAEVCKLMVHSRWRGQGIASLLMAALEGMARKLERGMLYLDTEAGSGAEGLYLSLGYTRVGEIPDYAASPDGTLHPTAIYYKQLIDRSLVPLAMVAESEA